VAELYPLTEPYAQGMLDVGDGNQIYWQAAGNPVGKPAVILHGGPGQGFSPNMGKSFDPSRYLTVGFDQRGCGQSTPHASDPATDLSVNTTGHLIADMERLREHLGIDRWLVCGGSWGSTLAVAYAERHPVRVTEVVAALITTSRRSESDWLYWGVASIFPEEFQRFRAVAPAATSSQELFAGYSSAMADPDPLVRIEAARAWARWEDTVLSLEPVLRPFSFGGDDEDGLTAMARICAHYAEHGAFLDEGALIRDAGLLAGIPGVLIHGRMDLSCPARTAWELAQAWPGARLLIDDKSGHKGSDTKNQWMVQALDAFAG
jgi:proline iminopeptidase